MDEIIERYKEDVDITLIRKNLRLTVEERFDQFMRVQHLAADVRRAAQAARDARRGDPPGPPQR